MTQEERELLFRDLSARLPYGVKVGFSKEGTALIPIKFDLQTKELFAEDRDNNCICIFRYDIFKPYLRPMSSMTMSEELEFTGLCLKHAGKPEIENMVIELSEFYNKKHLDYRGLIPMGLALEAPEGLYD